MAADDLVEVAPDILRLRLPLDEGIDHVNLYLVRDGAGWLLFDTGVDTADARTCWERLLAGPLAGGLTRIVVSHHHPDHLGLARWLHERTGAVVYLRPEERDSAEQTALPTPKAMDACRRYFEFHGMPADDASTITGDLLRRFMACDTRFQSQTLQHGDVLHVGRCRFQVLVQGGHSVAQFCLHDPAAGLLLTGDQLLERITPNLSLLPWGDRNPLRNYLASLEQTAALDLRCVLPAHHRVYHTGAERAQGLIRHHQRALQRFRERLRDGMRGMEVAEAIYGRRRDILDRFLALTESLAHLQYLEEQGEIRRDDENRWHFLAAARPPTRPAAAT
ncbi:MAG: MBL fold metallo-hydrolase [Panacagrimonas sp.]